MNYFVIICSFQNIIYVCCWIYSERMADILFSCLEKETLWQDVHLIQGRLDLAHRRLHTSLHGCSKQLNDMLFYLPTPSRRGWHRPLLSCGREIEIKILFFITVVVGIAPCEVVSADEITCHSRPSHVSNPGFERSGGEVWRGLVSFYRPRVWTCAPNRITWTFYALENLDKTST